MPITLLSDHTVRAIGSSLLLNDACSVVKELVDNALDAKSTSIFVEITANTLDVIQVKDNGIGIEPEDRQYACRMNCTSKLESISELKTIGGQSLSFRGQALASVVELSGEVAITTRIDGEVVASKLMYSRTGELWRSSNASHGVGSTVRIHDFLRNVPVRRQTALKSSPKTLTAIRKLLQAYAFARPHIRLSLKVLDGKAAKQNWIYGPKPNASVRDVATSVGGQQLATQCVSETVSDGERNGHAKDDAAAEPESGKVAQLQCVALLPKSDCDVSKISGGGQYISIDGRPITTTRGVGKEITGLYKSYLRSAVSSRANGSRYSDPFLCLQLLCAPGTYDVNIEPAKDDVLFADRALVMEIMASLFKRVYGAVQVSEDVDSDLDSPKKKQTVTNPGASAFHLLLARKPEVHLPTNAQIAGSTPLNDNSSNTVTQKRAVSDCNETLDNRETSVHRKMGPITAEELDMVDDTIDQAEIPEEDDKEIRDPRVTNPWSLAKVYATVKPHGPTGSPFEQSRVSPLYEAQDQFSSSPFNRRWPPKESTISNPAETLPSPSQSPSIQGCSSDLDQVLRRFDNYPVQKGSRFAPAPTPRISSQAQKPVDEDAIGQRKTIQEDTAHTFASPNGRTVETWIQSPRTTERAAPTVSSSLYRREGRVMHLGTSTTIPGGSISHDTEGSRQPAGRVNKPFVPPFKPSMGKGSSIKPFSQVKLTMHSSAPPSSNQASNSSMTANDLEEVMDFEYRKKAAQQAQRKGNPALCQQTRFPLSGGVPQVTDEITQVPQNDKMDTPSTNSPHRNRYLSAKQRLVENAEQSRSRPDAPSSSTMSIEAQPVTSLPSHGPRHRLFTEQKFKLKRTKSALLPLETTPKGQELHPLRTTLNVQLAVKLPSPETPSPTGISSEASTWLHLLRLYTSPHPSKGDTYIQTSGSSSESNDYISTDWADGDISASVKEVERWEKSIKQLLLNRRQENSYNLVTVPSQEPTPAEVEEPMHLFRHLKSFIEMLSSDYASEIAPPSTAASSVLLI